MSSGAGGSSGRGQGQSLGPYYHRDHQSAGPSQCQPRRTYAQGTYNWPPKYLNYYVNTPNGYEQRVYRPASDPQTIHLPQESNKRSVPLTYILKHLMVHIASYPYSPVEIATVRSASHVHPAEGDLDFIRYQDSEVSEKHAGNTRTLKPGPYTGGFFEVRSFAHIDMRTTNPRWLTEDDLITQLAEIYQSHTMSAAWVNGSPQVEQIQTVHTLYNNKGTPGGWANLMLTAKGKAAIEWKMQETMSGPTSTALAPLADAFKGLYLDSQAHGKQEQGQTPIDPTLYDSNLATEVQAHPTRDTAECDTEEQKGENDDVIPADEIFKKAFRQVQTF